MEATRPDRMNLPGGIYAAAKKLRSNKERGEFLMAVLALFFDGEEAELSERPDLLLDGWRDRIQAMRVAAVSGMQGGKAKAAARAEAASAKGEAKADAGNAEGNGDTPSDTMAAPLDQPYADPTGDPSQTVGGEVRSKNVEDSSKEIYKAEDGKPSAKEPRFKAEVAEIINHLNKTCGTNYRATAEGTARHVRARLAEGFTVDDCKRVVDVKAREWGRDPGMAKYLRPETLFGGKFEGYLNQPDPGAVKTPPPKAPEQDWSGFEDIDDYLERVARERGETYERPD